MVGWWKVAAWVAGIAATIAGQGLCAEGAPQDGSAPRVARYAALPALSELRMSPDGSRVALLRPIAGAMGLTVIDLVTRKERPLLVMDAATQQLERCDWASADVVVCSVEVLGEYPLAGRTAMKVLSERLVAVNVTTARSLMLDSGVRPYGHERFVRGDLLAVRPTDPEHILVHALWRSDVIGVNARVQPHVEKVNVVDGTRSTVQPARSAIDYWLADPNGDVRAGLALSDSGVRISVLREGDWQSTHLRGIDAVHDFQPLFVDARGEQIVAAARAGGPTRGVYVFDAKTGGVVRTLHEDPQRDFVGSAFVVRGELQALWVLGEQTRMVPLSAEAHAVAAELAGVFPEQALVPWSSDAEGKRLTVRSTARDRPTTWYVYDRAQRNLVRVGSEYPVESAATVISRWVTYSARDGTKIPALLQLPSADARGLPAVVIAHHEPMLAPRADYDSLVSMLVARGFAVLQPRYRGSYGFGAALVAAGTSRFVGAAAAADDLEDGLKWLRAEGIADASRACIVGRLYGGYVALRLAFRNVPGVRCVAVRSPLTDIESYLRHGYLAFIYTDVRSPRGPDTSFHDIVGAPVDNAGLFSVPLLVARPEHDGVQAEQVQILLDALAVAGKSATVVREHGVDPFDRVQANRDAWFGALDAFLGAALAGDAPTAPQ